MLHLLVIGYGSIGARHARIAETMGARVTLVSRRSVTAREAVYPSIEVALAAESFDCVVVANETVAHWATLDALRAAGYVGPILMEKPLAAGVPTASDFSSLLPAQISVAYNLRFHPALRRLKQALTHCRPIGVTLYAGQDLRGWRAGRDVGQCYSASRAQGGGVLRDLSHELDYFTWLFGRWKRLAALGGRIGPLPIDADDCWSILIETENAPVASVQIDYYHQPGARMLIVNTDQGTITVDLVRHSYRDSEGETILSVDRDMTYVAQLDAMLTGKDSDVMCSFAEGMETMRMIDAIERAANTRTWVSR